MMMLAQWSTSPACPGRISVVESISVTIAGPGNRCPHFSRVRSYTAASAEGSTLKMRHRPISASLASGPSARGT